VTDEKSTPHGFHIGRVGLGVTDLELARAFYEALGFVATPRFDLGTTIGDQSETPGSAVVIQIVRRDGFNLELVRHGARRSPGWPPPRRPMNQLGLTHLALAVDDLSRVVDVITRHGGCALGFTRSNELGVDAQFCTDPFGARLLLLESGPSRLGDLSAGADGIAVAHLGVCVADLDASAKFYDALGFEVGEAIQLDTAMSYLSELDGAPSRAQTVREGAFPLLLTQWGAPRDPGWPVRLPLNRTGDLIHFGTHCDDYDAMLGLVVAAGGTVVERTRSQFPPPGLEMPWEGEPHGWVFVLDPNGVEIEIVGPRGRTTSP
jgi:lactoylglutathione lyase